MIHIILPYNEADCLLCSASTSIRLYYLNLSFVLGADFINEILEVLRL